MNIVLVDDEPKIRQGMARLISKREGWNVDKTFDNAKEAVEYLEESQIDVLITDIRMPGQSGLEMIEAIRMTHPDLAIIILSGYTEFTYAQKAISLGVIRYLTKPTNPKELIEILEYVEKQIDYQEIKIVELENSNILVEKAMEYVAKNYNKKISLKVIAEEMFISPNYLCRLFKQETGINLVEYITQYRIEQAKKYLKNIELRVAEVAEMVGYHDTKYFSSSFKKITGMTPVEYRNDKKE